MNSAAETHTTLVSLEEIEAAHHRIADVVVETPFMENLALSDRYDARVYLKREDMQVVRSFKIRGAYNTIKSLPKSLADRGVICASAGNHAQGVALSCAKLGVRGKIFMPNPTPQQKVNKVKHFGKDWVDVVLTGDSFDDAHQAALLDAEQNNFAFIHPFDDRAVIAGQGTIGLEIFQKNIPLDVLLVAVGGGGLISGVGSYFKQVSPRTEIIAVESMGAPALHRSLKAGHVSTLDQIDTFADGIAVKQIGRETFTICQEVVDQSITVDEGKICSTILQLYNEEAIVVEPAGAVSIAALDQLSDHIKGKTVGIIVCGGNNDVNRTQEIRERAMLYEGKKHYFIIRFPQRAGALRDFLNVLGPNDDITHFEYTKKTNRVNGPALVGIELAVSTDFDSLLARMQAQGINFQHINDNPMLFEMLV